MSDQTSSCFLHRFDQCFCIVGVDSLEIDNFSRNSFFFEFRSNWNESSHQVSISDQSNIWAFSEHLGFFQLERIVSCWNIVFCVPVKSFRLKENNRVGVSDRGQQKPLGLDWISGNNHLQSRSMRKVSLRRLRMIQGSVSDSPPSSSESEAANIELIAWSVSELGGLVDNLIESWEYVIAKLDFSNGCVSNSSKTDSKSSDTLFG